MCETTALSFLALIFHLLEIVQWQSCHEQRAFLHSYSSFPLHIWDAQERSQYGRVRVTVSVLRSYFSGFHTWQLSFHAKYVFSGSSSVWGGHSSPPQKSLNAVVVAVVGQEMKDTFEVASISAPSDHNTALTEKQTLVEEYTEMQHKLCDSMEVDLWKILIVGWIYYKGRPKYGQSTYRLTTALCQKRSSSLPQFINPLSEFSAIQLPLLTLRIVDPKSAPLRKFWDMCRPHLKFAPPPGMIFLTLSAADQEIKRTVVGSKQQL